MHTPLSVGAIVLMTAIISLCGWTANCQAQISVVDPIHKEIFGRFVDPYDVVLDYTALDGTYMRPTPEDCHEMKPSALSWGVPSEDGPMFNGLYMDALCSRWKLTHSEADRAEARRLIKGMMFLANVGKTPGFIARGVATDGKTTYSMGSNDQTMPWFYGMWRYIHEGLATDEERPALVQKFVDVTKVIEKSDWRMPTDGPPSMYRGSIAHHSWESAARLLFLMKAMHELTGEEYWNDHYQHLAHEKGGKNLRTRLEICRIGVVFDPGQGPKNSWTSSPGVASLRALWELEKDPALKAIYEEGLIHSAELCAQSLNLIEKFDVNGTEAFSGDWRVMNEAWKPQTSEMETVAVANAGLRLQSKQSPRLSIEKNYMREPCFAAWIVSMSPDKEFLKQQRPAIKKVIEHYDYKKLYLSQFFPLESAWYRLELALGSEK
jgi:hypothetical protein